MRQSLSTIMSVMLLLLGPGGVLWAQTGEPAVTAFGYRIVNTYPHDLGAFTQGLLFHEGYLYEGTGKRGLSSLSKIDLDSGEVVMSTRLGDRYFGEGIEIVDDSIYQLTWQSHMVFEWALDDFSQRGTHYNATEGWGLAFDGEHLILSDGSNVLQFIDPENFLPVRKIEVSMNGNPIPQLNELEYINGEIWANVWQTDFILRVDPDTGRVNSFIDLTGLEAQTRVGSNEAVLNGIAWDEDRQRLFVTGKHWADLFEIELVEQ